MIIYSCITNGYDEIPDHYYDPEVRYVMFHDGTIEKKGPWEFIDIRDYCDLECPKRLSSYPKINPHKFFSEGEDTVWIDGCYVQTQEWVNLSKEIFKKNKFTHIRHPLKFNFIEEAIEKYVGSFSTREDILEICNLLKEKNYNFYKYSSPILCCIWRTITEEMNIFHDTWWEYSLIGLNRDQISFDYAKQKHNLNWQIIEDWLSVGVDWSRVTGKLARKKIHPQKGDLEQYLRKEEMLSEISKITKMPWKLYLKHDFSISIYRWVTNPELPRSTSK
jgi:hypothetical protein